MDVMLMSLCPDRATFQMPQDPTVCVPLNRGPLLPCLTLTLYAFLQRAWGRVPVLPILQMCSRSQEQAYSCACLNRVCAGGKASSCLQHKALCHATETLHWVTVASRSLGRALRDWLECRSSLSPMAPGPRKGARASRPSLGGKDLGGLVPIRTRPSCSALVVQEYRSMVFHALLDSWPLAQSPADLGH